MNDTATTPPPAAALRLWLHGAARVRTAAGRELPLQGRAAALVALAALEPGIRRVRAAAMIWPDAPSPRQNLRQQLLRFRQALGAPLVEGEDGLRLAAGVVLEAAAPGAALLAGEPTPADGFGLWLSVQRQAQRQPVLHALAAAETAGDMDAALQQAHALLALDAEDESHHLALMRVHFLRAEPEAGLAAYERLVQQRAALAGGPPGAAAQEMASVMRQQRHQRQQRQRLQRQTPTALSTGQQPLPVTLRRPPLMAGRNADMTAVTAAWSAGRAVLVEGEAGMGKSRLLAECLAAHGGPALHAAARPGDSGAPYSSLARLLRPLLDQACASPGPPSQAVLVVLSRLGMTEPNPSGDVNDAVLSAGAVQAAVGEWLLRAGTRCVALDDLHFADAATLELLSALMAPESACDWLLAQRPAEQPPAAAALRHGLTELRRLSVVALTPLGREATAEMLDALALPGLDGTTLAPLLVQHSGGNPLFMLETLKQGLQDGSLARGELPRPGTVGALIEQRLQRLSPPALALARVAAIAGVDFSIELAEAAIGQSAVQLASAWRELQDAQVFREETLAHDLVADAALRGVPPVVARRVHAQCAAWLAGEGGGREAEPTRVASHWLAGGQPQAAALAFEAAARRARAAARQIEEADLYGQAARAYAEAGLRDARFEALACRVTALIGARSDDAALAEARALPDEAGNDLQRVRALRVLTDQLGQRGPFEDSVAVGEQGMALARRIGAQEELVRLTSLTAGNQIKIGRTADAYSLMLPLREWVDREADDELKFVWYGYWAAVLGHTGRLREGVAGFDVAIACAERSGARPNLSMALTNQSVVLRTMGALPRAREVSARALGLLAEDNDSAQYHLAQLMQARNDAETGRLGDAQGTLDDLLPHFEAMGAPFWVHALRATQARLWQHLGQHARALQALQLDDAGMPAWMQAGRVWLQLEIEQWLGRPAAAGHCDHALALLDGDANRRTGNVVRGLRFAPAERVLGGAEALADSARSMELFGALAALQMHRARAATALQRHAEAAAAAADLVRLLNEGFVPDFVYTPEAWLVAGKALQSAGRRDAARAALAAGQQWVRGQALPHVPAPFIDSFLHRNPVNRELLAAAT